MSSPFQPLDKDKKIYLLEQLKLQKEMFMELLPPGRQRSLILTKLDEIALWIQTYKIIEDKKDEDLSLIDKYYLS